MFLKITNSFAIDVFAIQLDPIEQQLKFVVKNKITSNAFQCKSFI